MNRSEDKNTGKTFFWDFIDRIQGDKVILIIISMLILFSIVTIFSSTSLLANADKSRLDIFKEQMVIVVAGVAIIAICYIFSNIWIYRNLSQLGFLVSATILILLHTKLGVRVNDAVRAIKAGPIQIHAYEVTKVAMVMYLAWAVHAYKNNQFWLANTLSKKFRKLSFLSKQSWKLWLYIFIPIMLICMGVVVGSVSSTAFIGGIMVVTIMIGGIKFKEIMKMLPLLLLGGIMSVAIWFTTGGEKLTRVGTAFSRLGMTEIVEKVTGHPVVSTDEVSLEDLRPGTREFQDYLDKIRQPESAKVAIHEGGFLGKGPGNSTQKYTVPLMFSDYMYSFILEEYGLLGGIFVLSLFVSLLARGSIIVRSCDNDYSKTVVAGLTILISAQALMHMFINADLGPLTGQTLPMISDGKSSFICFSFAFGVLLAISKMAKKKIQKEEERSEPLVEGLGIRDNNVSDTLDELDKFESDI